LRSREALIVSVADKPVRWPDARRRSGRNVMILDETVGRRINQMMDTGKNSCDLKNYLHRAKS
jgi:hypothetical protein